MWKSPKEPQIILYRSILQKVRVFKKSVSLNPIRFIKIPLLLDFLQKQKKTKTKTKTKEIIFNHRLYFRNTWASPLIRLMMASTTLTVQSFPLSIYYLRFLRAILPNNRYFPWHTHKTISVAPPLPTNS